LKSGCRFTLAAISIGFCVETKRPASKALFSVRWPLVLTVKSSFLGLPLACAGYRRSSPSTTNVASTAANRCLCLSLSLARADYDRARLLSCSLLAWPSRFTRRQTVTQRAGLVCRARTLPLLTREWPRRVVMSPLFAETAIWARMERGRLRPRPRPRPSREAGRGAHMCVHFSPPA